MVHFPDLSWDKYLCKISPVSLQTFQQSSVSIQLIIAFTICSIWYLSWVGGYNSKIPTARRVFPIFCQNTRRCGRCGANLEEKSILWADIKLEYAKLSRSAWQDQAEYDHIYVISISIFTNLYLHFNFYIYFENIYISTGHEALGPGGESQARPGARLPAAAPPRPHS